MIFKTVHLDPHEAGDHEPWEVTYSKGSTDCFFYVTAPSNRTASQIKDSVLSGTFRWPLSKITMLRIERLSSGETYRYRPQQVIAWTLVPSGE